MTMDAFTVVEGIAAPLLINNIDTDSIIPSRETQSVSRDGYGEKLFANWRYLSGTREPDPGFVLNQFPFDRAVVLLAGSNFGCGSSREAAVWSLKQFGIRAIIAESYGAIFYNNCIRNGLLPVRLSKDSIEQTALAIGQGADVKPVCVDLVDCEVRTAGLAPFSFTVAERDREMLLTGQDEVALTLQRRDAIEAFRARDRQDRPWLYEAATPGRVL